MNNTKRPILIISMLVLLALACNFPSAASGGNDGLQTGLVENYMPQNAATAVYHYSDAQQAVIAAYGSPTRFTILYTAETRHETWVYDADGYEVVFHNGEQLAERTFEAAYQPNMYATTYTPQMFFDGMGIDEIVAATGEHTFVLSNANALVEGGRLMHLEGLSVGLVNNRINYVEAIPAATQILLVEADFAQSPTAEPAAEAAPTAAPEPELTGTHSYQAVVRGGLSDVAGFPFEASIDQSGESLILDTPFLKAPITMAPNGAGAYVYQAAYQTFTLTYPLEDGGFLLVSDSEDVALQYAIEAMRAPMPDANPNLSTAEQQLAGRHDLICDIDFGEFAENGRESFSYVRYDSDGIFIYDHTLVLWARLPNSGPAMYTQVLEDGSERSIYITDTRYTIAKVDEEMRAAYVMNCYYPEGYGQ